jgi:hypothetical protein
MTKTVSVPKVKRVAARTPAAPKKMGITHISAFSCQKDDTGYAEFRYARASYTILGKIHRYQVPMLIDGNPEN